MQCPDDINKPYLQKFHSKVNTGDLTIGDLEIAGPSRASADYDGVILVLQFTHFNVDTNVGVGYEGLGSVICLVGWK
jgi:hypothetical protein